MALSDASNKKGGGGDPGEDRGGRKKQTIEAIYQKKTQLEHILLRPDTYIGAVEGITQQMFVWDKEKKAIVNKNITYVPGLYKIFDEILVNAADNKVRDPSMNSIKITISQERNLIKIWNNGKGIPVEVHKEEKMYVPAMIFGTLLTSSNYDDTEKKVVGGRNGYGAKLCNIFSNEFTVETSSSESGKLFKQTWRRNMTDPGQTLVKDSKSDFTSVSFIPDLSKFGMTHLDDDIISLLTRRAYDIAACTKGVRVYLNGEQIPANNFKDYIMLYLKGVQEEEDSKPKIVHEIVNDRWEIALTISDSGFQQASFVNSIATSKGGTHINYVMDQLVPKLVESAKKKLGKGSVNIQSVHVKQHIWLFVNCLIENPAFDSQTKENMTLKAKSFGSECKLSDKFVTNSMKCGVLDRIVDWAQHKSQAELSKKCFSSKRSKLKGIGKLDDANDAGTKSSKDCTLILTEGDSARALAVAGLGVIGRDKYGVFPLRGKVLNVREANHKQISGNEELTNLVKIFGLQYGKKYSSGDVLSTLRYGRMMIMADQDQDGSHIKGLLINFIHYNWPELLRTDFLEQFITPIVKATKGHEQHAFFSLPEFEHWKSETANWKTYHIKYYKGLGTSTAKEAREYFSDMDRHQINFSYSGPPCDDSISMAFSKNRADDRKHWISSWLQRRKEQRDAGLDESYLYSTDNRDITYTDFVNKELILFSNADNERAIPNLLDGLKPSQRKVLFTCFKRKDKRDVKVAQLAGSVSEISAYHHGEASLMSTIVNMAQNYVGSNNINLLQPIGMFGTRLRGGKDAASARYIFTMLSPLARLIFPTVDDPLLNYLYDDNLRVEPDWYCPILPLLLANGAAGIGTGYSTSIPLFSPREIVSNLKKMIRGEEPGRMDPFYKGFKGTLVKIEPHKYICCGVASRLSSTQLEISELPVNVWTQNYKESVLEPMLQGAEKSPPFIQEYREYHTDTTVRFIVTLSAEKMAEAERTGIHKKFKIETTISTRNFVLFDPDLALRQFDNELQILKTFFPVRLEFYKKRRLWLINKLEAEAKRLQNQARFILEKLSGEIAIENKKKAAIISMLQASKYDSDPVKKWQKSISDLLSNEASENEDEEATDGSADFNYLLAMPLWNLSQEKKDEILQHRDKKLEELEEIRKNTPEKMWVHDLDVFLEELERVEQKEREDEQMGVIRTGKSKGKKGGKDVKRQAKLFAQESLISDACKEVVPPIIPEYNPNPKILKEKSEGDLPKSKIKKIKDENKPKKETTAAEVPADSLDDDDDDDDDVMEVVPLQRPKRNTSNKDTYKLDDSGSESEQELRSEESFKKPTKFLETSSESEEEFKPMEIPKKSPAKKKQEPKPKPKPTKKSQPAKKAKFPVPADSLDDDDDDLMEILPSRPKRITSKDTYKIDDSSSNPEEQLRSEESFQKSAKETQSDESESEEEFKPKEIRKRSPLKKKQEAKPKPAKPAKKSQPAKKTKIPVPADSLDDEVMDLESSPEISQKRPKRNNSNKDTYKFGDTSSDPEEELRSEESFKKSPKKIKDPMDDPYLSDNSSILGKGPKGRKRPAGKSKQAVITVIDSDDESDCVVSASSSDDDFVVPTSKRKKTTKTK